jgi:hypothetical protein
MGDGPATAGVTMPTPAGPMATLRQFTLKDADGNEHAYQLVLHDAMMGQKIMWDLVALSGETLGGLMQSLLENEVGSIAGLLDKQAADLATLVDWAGVGRDIAAAVGKANMPELTTLLLRHTTRDGNSLANPVHFNQAYQANYFELGQALWQILRENRFLPL